MTRYIASYAIPISEDGEMISDSRAKELLEGQKILADQVEARVRAAKASSAR